MQHPLDKWIKSSTLGVHRHSAQPEKIMNNDDDDDDDDDNNNNNNNRQTEPFLTIKRTT
jgi:hypothetical protein